MIKPSPIHPMTLEEECFLSGRPLHGYGCCCERCENCEPEYSPPRIATLSWAAVLLLGAAVWTGLVYVMVRAQ